MTLIRRSWALATAVLSMEKSGSLDWEKLTIERAGHFENYLRFGAERALKIAREE